MEKLEKFKQLAEKIKKAAENAGAESNYLFLTTFNRYEMQLKILDDLEKEISKGEVMIEKTYIKGSGNLCIHPAIKTYNVTADSANKTARTLLSILKEFDFLGGDDDPLVAMINGSDDN